MDYYFEPTEEERKAIQRLERATKNWPDSLWLWFQGDGDGLLVMRKNEAGRRIEKHDGHPDPRAEVGHVMRYIEIDAGLF